MSVHMAVINLLSYDLKLLLFYFLIPILVHLLNLMLLLEEQLLALVILLSTYLKQLVEWPVHYSLHHLLFL